MRLGVTAALAAATAFAMPAAHAADPMAPASVGWTSCYVGGNLGGAWSHTNVNDELSGYLIASLDADAVIGGGQIGCDYQLNSQWVVGVQGLIDATGLKSDTTSLALDPLTLHGSIPWVGTLTGRFGYLPAPDWMIYAKGGVAWNHTDSSLTYLGSTVSKVGFGQTGWTAGIGAEWKANPRWSFFGEYDYMGFSASTVTLPGPNIGVVNQNVQAVLFGVNFHLN
jgi:outer membrane immunogenic protein